MDFSRLRCSTNKGAFAPVGVLSLLVLYLIGTVEIASLHSVLHNTVDETGLHSEGNETNACHQNVYHNKKENCEHRSHIAANKECPFCQLSMQSSHFFDGKLPSSFLNLFNRAIGENHPLQYCGDGLSLLPSRAPPLT